MSGRNTLTLRALDIPTVHKFGIGFDGMMTELMRMTEAQQTNYPPYNIIKLGEDDFSIELAVAGFSEGEVSISQVRRILTISGTRPVNDGEYLHKGISDRSFTREFTLAEHVEVDGASQKNGILSIKLKRTVPEDAAPKSIDINFNQ
jgi:molecular chaperone IbpA